MRHDARGFTVVELLVALAITLVMCGGLLVFVRIAAAAIRTQPERADVQQRLRNTVDMLVARLDSAGAGPTAGGGAIPFARRVPVIFPHRRGPGADLPMSAFSDRFTVYAIPEGGAISALATDPATPGDPFTLAWTAGCASTTPTCRFTVGDTIVVFDATGAHDVVTVTGIGPNTLQHSAAVSRLYRPALGAAVASVEVRTVFFDGAAAQLRIASPTGMNQPLADNVVDFAVSFYGEAQPPVAPRPPPGEDGCVIDAAGGVTLASLSPNWGSLVQLPPSMLSDGPACGSGAAAFDADLFRVRQVRLRVRVQASADSYRGGVAAWFRRPGPANDVRMMVPDAEVTVDVVPRNLLGGR